MSNRDRDLSPKREKVIVPASLKTTQTRDFSRFEEFHTALAQIKTRFAPLLQTQRGALSVKSEAAIEFGGGPPVGLRSIGVSRLLSNYYRPSEKENEELAKLADPLEKIDWFAYRHALDEDTRKAKVLKTVEQQFELYDENMIIDDVLANQFHMVPIGEPEFNLCLPTLQVREFPGSGVWLHLVGRADRMRYNSRTRKLVIVELKTSAGKGKSMFMKMSNQFLKEKHCKQLTFYAFMLLLMAADTRIKLTSNDIELLLIGCDRGKRTIAVWQLQYDPQTFLGENWASERWHPLLGSSDLRIENPHSGRKCGFEDCRKPATLRSARHPDAIYCGELCAARPHCCLCGNIPSLISPSTQRVYCRSCVALGQRV